jgi:hypothetical protein
MLRESKCVESKGGRNEEGSFGSNAGCTSICNRV